MDPNDPVTAKQRQGILAFVCAVPALFIGFYMFGLIHQIGSHHDFVSVLKRGAVCSIPAAWFALVLPRFWFVPSAAYGLGISCAYLLSSAAGDAVRALIAIPVFALTDAPITVSESGSGHSKFSWIIWAYIIAVWVAAFISMLRLHFEKKGSAI